MRTVRIGIAAAAAAVCLVPASPAGAAVSCSLDAGTKTLAVTAGSGGDTPRLSRTAGGNLIVLSDADTVVACTGGSGTVTTVDAITVTDTSGSGTTTLTVDMTEGTFAPGAFSEPFFGSEIEITADLGGGNDYVHVIGRSAGDNLRLGMPAAGEADINVNPGEVVLDRDLHLVSVNQVGFNLGDGDDRLEMRGGSATGDPFTMTSGITLGAGNDTLVGGDGQNTVNAGEGNDAVTGGATADTITPGPGDDVLEGGAGNDSIAFFSAAVALSIDLATTGPQPTGEGTDTYTGIESIYGGPLDDVLSGDAGANGLSGGGGDDRIAGRGGDDYLDGGSGFDTVDYAGAPAGVTVKLDFNMQQQDTGGEGMDTVSEFEAIRGSAFADTLTGGTDGNVLQGLGGADTLAGLGGPDTVLVRDGEGDTVDCGSGPDTAVTDEPGVDALTACETVEAEALQAAQPGGGGATPGGDPGPGAGGELSDTVAPALTGVRFRPAAFRARRGGRLRLSASEAAALQVVVERCARRCRRVRGTTAAVQAGTRTVRVRTRGLRPGRYRVRIVAIDSAGNRSAERRARFRIRR